MFVSNIESGIGLRADQGQRLVKLIVADTKPPRKYGNYDYYVVIYQMSKMKDDKFKAILDDAQWQSLKKTLVQYGGMEQFLRSQGYLE